MSKHTEELRRLGELTLNDWLALGIKLGGRDRVRELQICDKVTVKFDAARKEATVEAEKPSQSCLRLYGKVDLPARPDHFDPQAFFKTGRGLYVWDDFVNRILSVARPTETLPQTTFESWSLLKNATDAQIRSELPADHIFEDASTFCAYLASMIGQPGGAEGSLLNNGYANIFYVRGVAVEVFAVDVRWFAGARGWGVSAVSLGGRQWGAGGRAFSRTAAA